jgi:hypothetical protein
MMGVIDIGWHTGLIIPAGELTGTLRTIGKYFRVKPRYWIIGWGNRSYYMAKNPSIWEGISALFPSRSVVMMRAVQHLSVVTHQPGIRTWWLPLNFKNRNQLDAYIAHFILNKPSSRFIFIKHGPYPHSKFFASTGRYDLFHTCNSWTINALKKSEFPVHTSGVIFAGQVASQLNKLKECR